jgi:hypothetical protein
MDTEKNYEFDSGQNETILTLAKTLQFVGAVALVLALVIGVGALGSLFQAKWGEAIFQSMFLVFTFSMGSLMIKAGKEFQAIVATTGKDISHLMTALDNLRQMYSILSVIIILFVLLMIIALAVSLVYSGGELIAFSASCHLFG